MEIKRYISAEEFARVCYLVLMQNGEGILDKHPDYINEKLRLLDAGFDAFGALDLHNMRRVKGWCDRWGVQMPEGASQYLSEIERVATAQPILFNQNAK